MMLFLEQPASVSFWISTGFTYLEKAKSEIDGEIFKDFFFIASKKLKICTTRKNNEVFKKLKIS